MGTRVCVTSFRMLLRHMDIKSHLTTQCRGAGMRFMSVAAATATNTITTTATATGTTTAATILPSPAATTASLTATTTATTRRGNSATTAASPFRQNSWHLSRRHYSSSDVKSGELTTNVKGEVFVEFIQGLPHLTVPLPSRNEKCRFALMPVNHRVGDLIDMLKEEDRGIDRATVLNHAGVRIASTCSIESLMDEPFWLQINDNKYKVEPPQRIRAQTEDLNRLGDVRSLVAQLYEALHVNEYHISKEKELAGRLEKLQFELTPLEERKTELSNRAERRNAFLTWFGLGLMSVQFGILARLTWWEYSWDIMEPVTYFVTYGTTIAFYAYYCVTKMEYSFTDVKNREYLLFMHKQARKSRFDIEKYNALKREIADVEYDLRRLRDPLNMQMSPQVYRTVADQSSPPALGDDGASGKPGTHTAPLKGFKLPFLETKN